MEPAPIKNKFLFVVVCTSAFGVLALAVVRLKLLGG